MDLQLVVANTVVGAVLLLPLPSSSTAQTKAEAARPRVVEASSVDLDKNAQLASLITEIRNQADAFVFLSGGARECRRTTNASCSQCSMP